MSGIQGIARQKIHPGRSVEFKRLAAEYTRVAREKDTGTLRTISTSTSTGASASWWSATGIPQHSKSAGLHTPDLPPAGRRPNRQKRRPAPDERSRLFLHPLAHHPFRALWTEHADAVHTRRYAAHIHPGVVRRNAQRQAPHGIQQFDASRCWWEALQVQ